MTDVLIRERFDTEAQREESCGKTEAGIGEMWSQDKEGQGLPAAPETRREAGNGVSLGAPEGTGNQPTRPSDLGPPASGTVREDISAV